MRVDDDRVAVDDQRIAVRRRARHRLVGDRGAAARAVLDDDRRSLVLGDVLAEEPRQDVGAAAGRERHHDADRARLRPGVVIREREQAQRRRMQPTRPLTMISSLAPFTPLLMQPSPT